MVARLWEFDSPLEHPQCFSQQADPELRRGATPLSGTKEYFEKRVTLFGHHIKLLLMYN